MIISGSPFLRGAVVKKSRSSGIFQEMNGFDFTTEYQTVFALSAPVGGAITVMRLTGPGSRAVLERVFTGAIEHRRASFGRVIDENGETVDTCTAVFYEAPHSYTGEDMAEISIHGSYAVAQRLSELIENTGIARPAQAGEFTKRAYLNGKLDLAQAEAVMDLISSTAERQRRAAARQLEGRLSAVIASLYERLKTVCAEAAAAMDDDTEEYEISPEKTIIDIIGIKDDIIELADGGARARILREGARVAITGSPNAGKSSLLNALIRRERSIVTEIPGTTRDTVEETASIDGIPVVFIDTAGIHETQDTVEKIGIERTRREIGEADIVLWLIDGAKPLSDEDEAAYKASLEGGKKTVAVITKSDLEQVISPDEEGVFRSFPAVIVSSLTGEGMTRLTRTIAGLIAPGDRDSVVTNTRHISALREAARGLEAAAENTREQNPDAAFFELRGAMDKLAAIIGREDPSEELVDSIFASFCVGK